MSEVGKIFRAGNIPVMPAVSIVDQMVEPTVYAMSISFRILSVVTPRSKTLVARTANRELIP
jgi:hypothetical protein